MTESLSDPAAVTASSALKLTAEQLFTPCDPGRWPFETTEDMEALPEVLGQARAVEAIEFAIGIRREGYNLFVMGPQGSGRHSIVRRFIEEKAAVQPAGSDWCYVDDFSGGREPRALMLPPGRGRKLQGDMARLVETLFTAIPGGFATEEYKTKQRKIEYEFARSEEREMTQFRERSRSRNVAVLAMTDGIELKMTKDGRELTPEEFDACGEEERESLQKSLAETEEELGQFFQTTQQRREEADQQVSELRTAVTRALATTLIDQLKQAYADCPAVPGFLTEVLEDIVGNFEAFLEPDDGKPRMIPGIPMGPDDDEDAPFRRYGVNVMVDHGDSAGAPVIYEDNPTHDNLVGCIEFLHEVGILVTDFNLIKPGALHRANGGYLVVDALKVLIEPFAWEALKRALRSREIRVESIGQKLSLISTVSLEPQPIPLDLKVVLVGERSLYYLLHQVDPEFGELFKVAADFEEEMVRSPEATAVYARLVGTLARNESLRPFDRTALARVIEHSSRVAGDAEKISLGMQRITDLMSEADHFAGLRNRTVVSADHVQGAIDAQERRAGRVRESIREEIRRGTLLIDTAGEQIAQVNALSVVELGGYAFGFPSRITARVRLGGGRVVNIEREVKLSGPAHSKGVLILSGFLGGRYIPEQPLSLAASLVFEQSYGGVDGDSASLAELCALLSALAGAPIRQSLAITGSINQHGEVQPIGGVNEKIEGFFDICNIRGLSGTQGVVIPTANLKNLMLRKDVVDAVAAGKFHVYAVSHSDEAIALLTGVPSGERGSDGQFPADTLNHRVEQRLVGFAESARAFHSPAGNGGERPESPKSMTPAGKAGSSS